MRLLLSQRNEIFRLIQQAGMDTREFEWTAPDPRGIERIQHGSSGYAFAFSATELGQYIDYSPGPIDVRVHEEIIHWSQVPDHVRIWLQSLKRELDEPDLWAELEREKELLGGGDGEQVENTAFTLAEQQQIAAQLSEAQDYVRQTQELSPEQMHALEARIDYLIDAAARLPRLDWRNALVGTLIAYTLEVAVPPEVVRDLLGMIFRGLGQLFGLDLPPPQLPYSPG